MNSTRERSCRLARDQADGGVEIVSALRGWAGEERLILTQLP